MTADFKPPGEERFPPTRRLLHRVQFDEVFTRGRKFVRPLFVVHALACVEETRASRIGCVVSRKVGNAVVRNRMKRLLRETFRRAKLAQSIDVVVVVRPSAANKPNTQFIEDFASFLAGLETQ